MSRTDGVVWSRNPTGSKPGVKTRAGPRNFVLEIKIVSDNRLSEKRPAANVPRRQTSICTGELRIVYLKRDLRQTCHVDKRAFVPEIKIVSDNRLSEKRPAANVPRRRPRSRTAAGRLGSGDVEAEAGGASEAATAATWMTEAGRAHCRPRSLFKKRFETI